MQTRVDRKRERKKQSAQCLLLLSWNQGDRLSAIYFHWIPHDSLKTLSHSPHPCCRSKYICVCVLLCVPLCRRINTQCFKLAFLLSLLRFSATFIFSLPLFVWFQWIGNTWKMPCWHQWTSANTMHCHCHCHCQTISWATPTATSAARLFIGLFFPLSPFAFPFLTNCLSLFSTFFCQSSLGRFGCNLNSTELSVCSLSF